MIALLVIAAALLFVPALRRSAGALAGGTLFLLAMTLTFGEAGALVALAAGLAAFAAGLYRR